MNQLHRRIAALERAVAAAEIMAPCLACGFPTAAKRLVVLHEDEELGECEFCGSRVHPTTGEPVADVAKVIRLGAPAES